MLTTLTRGRVALATVALLLVLDIGRSINARVAYATPSEAWQPDPAVYADLTWPPGADVSPAAPVGARVYAQRCAVCHGPDGRGNGPAAPSLIPRPRDFTLGLFKYKSTPPGEPPTDRDLEEVVANGLSASAMPYFRDLLTEAEIHAVVSRVKVFSRVFSGLPPASITVPPSPAVTTASTDRGRALYHEHGCAGCHGDDGRRGGILADVKDYPTHVRDLSAPWSFHGGSGPNQIWLRLTTGLPGSMMPSYATALTSEERWDVVRYVQSLVRVPPWEPGGRLGGRGQDANLLRRGEYLVRAEMCGLCHTQLNRTGIYRGDDAYLAGGMRVGAYPHGVFVSRNLTSDNETGIGRWTEAQIVNAVRNGRTPNRLLSLWGMPWFFLHHLSDEDATAIARYLKTLPPVRNHIPAPLHYGVIETVASKLTRPLPAARVTVLTYADGDFGTAGRSRGLREWPQTTLINGQWVVLIAGTFAFVFAGPRQHRLPRTARTWLIAIASLFALLLVGVVGWALYGVPTLGIVPPERIVSAVTAQIPRPDTSGVTTERKALVERGRYLFTIASCAFCHGQNGAGGQKISWKPFGTLWTRNITPDTRTGIGGWTDDQVSRAIRSGITPDGRTLHWQGMIWDHASNWDEEDLRALIAYLRLLPPVSSRIPPARPPARDDCVTYTFWIANSTAPGCL